MELDYKSGKLNVNYGDHLVTLLREVRQLLAMGFAVPVDIQKLAELGQKYFRQGVVLKQVANLYNSIDQQMLHCQQSMLLAQALNFERLVKNPKGSSESSSGVTWDDPKELEQFVSRLQLSADKLTSENRKLRQFHVLILEQVSKLMGIDLIKNQIKWKEGINNIRAIINTAYDNGMNHENTLSWRNHWDYQLYKALEFQYRVGLENLHDMLPEIKVDLVYKQQKLQFRPNFEELRAKYYREMKKIINIPSSFTGLGETNIFAHIVERNSDTLMTVYTFAENLFSRLLKVMDIFKDWVILGAVDLEEFVEDSLENVGDWEMNFRAVKQKGKEAEHLPLTIKIDCLNVNAAPVKATIDDHIQRLFEALQTSLRKAIVIHIKYVEQFIDMAMEMLLKRPQTIAEIGYANLRHEELSKNKISIQSHFEKAEAKNKLLKHVCGSGVDTTSAKTKWNKLELMLESHELMITEQVLQIKSSVDGRVNVFLKDLEKFAARWYELKPRTDCFSVENAKNAIEFIKNKAEEFGEFTTIKKQLLEDTEHFGAESPDFSVVDTLQSDINEAQDIWLLCEEYIEALEKILNCDWISFRTNLSSMDDFFLHWTDRMNSRKMNAISTHILNDIDNYRHTFPYLKYLRGDNWMPEHWGELFRLLQFPKGASLSELTVRKLLDVKHLFENSLEKIHELNNRANGEVSIRDALQELEIWGASALFSLTEYEDAKNTKIFIIKEWKEILTQVGDSQSLLQSLKDSVYIRHFSENISIWERKLADLDEYLRKLNGIQRKWVYLEPIFSRGSLPSEQVRFSRIDEDFRSIVIFFNFRRVVYPVIEDCSHF